MIAQPKTMQAAVAELPEIFGTRLERNPLFRGWCNICGTVIFPGRFNWYCRSCALLMRSVNP